MSANHDKPRRTRDPKGTRERLLQAAFQEVYRYGFQSAGIDTILAATNVTKGALYYHFESKEALGCAIIEEIVAKLTSDRWMLPLQQSKDKDPIDALIGVVQAIPHQPKDVKGGCPLVNLTQEMSQLDEQFRKRLERIFRAWQEGIATTLRRGSRREQFAAIWFRKRLRAFWSRWSKATRCWQRMPRIRRRGTWESEISWAG